MAKITRDKEKEYIQGIAEYILKNAKADLTEIAKHLGISRQTASKMVKKMEDNHTIWGYCSVLDFDKFGLNTYVLLTKSKRLVGKESSITNKFKETVNWPDCWGDCTILYSALLHGEYDGIVIYVAKDIIEARKMGARFMESYINLVDDYKIIQVILPFRINGITNPEVIKKLESLS